MAAIFKMAVLKDYIPWFAIPNFTALTVLQVFGANVYV